MNLDDISRGRYFIFEEHPAFILTDPFIPKGKPKGQTQEKVICVNASSVRDWRGEKRIIDKTCLLKKGDHYSITHDSFIAYKRAECISTNHEALQNLPLAVQSQGQDPYLSNDILIKICKGLLKSNSTDKKIKNYYRQAVEQGRAYKI